MGSLNVPMHSRSQKVEFLQPHLVSKLLSHPNSQTVTSFPHVDLLPISSIPLLIGIFCKCSGALGFLNCCTSITRGQRRVFAKYRKRADIMTRTINTWPWLPAVVYCLWRSTPKTQRKAKQWILRDHKLQRPHTANPAVNCFCPRLCSPKHASHDSQSTTNPPIPDTSASNS